MKTRLLLTSLASSAVIIGSSCLAASLLLGCGGSGGSTDIKGTMRFADRTDAEISRLVSAAGGSEGFQAQASVGSFDTFGESNPDPCPAIAISGNTVTITGGCTTRENVMIEGSASITNPLGWGGGGAEEVEYDYTEDTIYAMNGFAITQVNQRRAFDGIFTIGSMYSEMDMDVTSDLLGIAVRSDIFMDCGRTSCSINNSGVELVGVGGATVSGSVSVSGQTAEATYTLKGADTVKVTMKNNCVSWTLDGTDRAFNPCQR
jgi:hypothetical protein